LRASPRRVSAGPRSRGTRITFRLSAPARVVFVVRGPAPSCAIVGRFNVRGRPGVNHVRFKGKIGRRTLAPGTYALTVRRAPRLRRVVVIIGSQPRARFDCSDAGSSVFTAALPRFGRTSSAEPAPPAEEQPRGVLPTITKKIRALPKAIPMPPIPKPSMPRPPGDAPPTIVGLLALALLALSAIAIVAYVIRFLRGPGAKSA
ncbi:MAG TPA: hypothetical protein VG144_11180, partial [Gaiellaceae bacterium]|nr:hypothetical protein [Gaiellaceae bacterium]